jgi:hypothetical protein
VLPSEAAWQALQQEAKAANKTLTKVTVDAIMAYLYANADVASVVGTAAPVRTSLAGFPAKSLAAVCPKGTNATLVFAFDEAPPTAQPAAAGGSAVLGAAPLGAPLGAAAPGAALGAGPISARGTVYGAGAGAGPSGTLGAPAVSASAALGLPAAAAPAAGAAYPAAFGATPQAQPAATAGGYLRPAAPQAPAFAGQRHLLQKLPTGSAVAASNADALVLPTAFSGAARKDGAAVIPGPIVVIDGAAQQLDSVEGIKVGTITYACDGAIYHVDRVPLPCNFLGRRAAATPAPLAPRPVVAAPAVTTINASLVNTTNIPGAVPMPKSAAAAAAPMLASAAAAALLGALLL